MTEPMRPRKSIPRRTPLPRGGPPRATNPARKKREFERCYHSLARRKFVQARPCVVSDMECQYYEGHSVNAHVVDDGSKGGARKSGYRCITEMCDWHHHVLDNVERRPEFEARRGIDLQACADATEAAWLASTGGA